MIGREHYFFDELKDMDEKEIVSGFIKQYYLENKDIPAKIMCEEEFEDREVLEKLLTEFVAENLFLVD